MNGRVARQLRKTQEEKPKQFSKPFMAMLPEGPLNEKGERELIPIEIPRKMRRVMIKQMKADMRKGRLNVGRS